MQKLVFSRIGIMLRYSINPLILETFEALIKFLYTLPIQSVVVAAEAAQYLSQLHEDIQFIKREELGKHCDLLIVIGGDGSLLTAARMVVQEGIPILGINRGRLGFLTDISPVDLKLKLKAILQGSYQEESRVLLTAHLYDTHQNKVGQQCGLNDAVLSSRLHMINFAIFIADQFVCDQSSDGLIVSTPTGSTAYSLSGGGPILHPQLDALLLLSMFPHTLTMRPLVVRGDTKITIRLNTENNVSAVFRCDGQDPYVIKPGYTIEITQNPHRLKLIHPLDYQYFATLRSKLQWGS